MLWGSNKKRSSSTSCSAGGLLWICSFLGCSGGDFWEDWCCKFVERGFLLSGKLRLKFPEALQVVVGCLRWQPVFLGHAKDKLLHWYGMSWYSRIERWHFVLLIVADKLLKCSQWKGCSIVGCQALTTSSSWHWCLLTFYFVSSLYSLSVQTSPQSLKAWALFA